MTQTTQTMILLRLNQVSLSYFIFRETYIMFADGSDHSTSTGNQQEVSSAPSSLPNDYHNGGYNSDPSLPFADITVPIKESIFQDYQQYSTNFNSTLHNHRQEGQYWPSAQHVQSTSSPVVGAVSLVGSLDSGQPKFSRVYPGINGPVVPRSQPGLTNQHPTSKPVSPPKPNTKRKNNDISSNSPIPVLPRKVIADKLMSISPLTVSNSSASSPQMDVVSKGRQKPNPMLNFPILLFQALNGGDMGKVKEIIESNTVESCGLKTPAIDSMVYGQHYLTGYFQVITDDHPDCVWVAKKCKLQPSTSSLATAEVHCRIYFAGTRIYKPQYLSANTFSSLNYQESFSSDNYNFLVRNPNKPSLLDEMDTSQLSHQEIAAMKELESRGKNLSIFGKGTMIFALNKENKILSMNIDYIITSFREVDI
jgi:hypothetical protein